MAAAAVATVMMRRKRRDSYEELSPCFGWVRRREFDCRKLEFVI